MNNFYIYQYVRAKASKYGPVGSPYYIGKGRAKRAWRLGGRSVQRPLNKDQVVIVAEMLSETEAFTMETSLILTHGRIDLGTGYLRNRTNGGEGNSGRVISEETRRKMSIAKKLIDIQKNVVIPLPELKEVNKQMIAGYEQAFLFFGLAQGGLIFLLALLMVKMAEASITWSKCLRILDNPASK